MKRVVLKRKISNRIENGHPWVYNNEINLMDDSIIAGDTIEVVGHDGKFVGYGYINPKSVIPVRIISRDKNDKIENAFFLKKIKAAWEYRKKIGLGFWYTKMGSVFIFFAIRLLRHTDF